MTCMTRAHSAYAVSRSLAEPDVQVRQSESREVHEKAASHHQAVTSDRRIWAPVTFFRHRVFGRALDGDRIQKA